MTLNVITSYHNITTQNIRCPFFTELNAGNLDQSDVAAGSFVEAKLEKMKCTDDVFKKNADIAVNLEDNNGDIGNLGLPLEIILHR